MNRTPTVDVRRALRAEVGFGCPVGDCANPYLEYHHFDPPWAEREHHEPAGMVALCAMHHKKADGGSFTVEQLRALKRPTGGVVRERFDWMRRDMLSIVGGNFYYETPIIVQYRDQPVVWYERDEAGHFLLSVGMLTASDEPRLTLERNDWTLLGPVVDFLSPPHGHSIESRYANGDSLKVNFFDVPSAAALIERHPGTERFVTKLTFPMSTVEVHMNVGGTTLSFGPTWSKVGGLRMSGNFSNRSKVGLALG
jgi:hypothetical protein